MRRRLSSGRSRLPPRKWLLWLRRARLSGLGPLKNGRLGASSLLGRCWRHGGHPRRLSSRSSSSGRSGGRSHTVRARFLMTWDGDEVDPWPGKRGLGHVMTPVMACDGFMMLIDAYRLCYNNARIYIILYYCIISLLLLLLYIDIRSCRVAVLKGGTSKPMVGSHVSCMFVLAQCLYRAPEPGRAGKHKGGEGIGVTMPSKRAARRWPATRSPGRQVLFAM